MGLGDDAAVYYRPVAHGRLPGNEQPAVGLYRSSEGQLLVAGALGDAVAFE
ncbi:hypothetical protein D3C80_2211010 [compost metagenome]